MKLWVSLHFDCGHEFLIRVSCVSRLWKESACEFFVDMGYLRCCIDVVVHGYEILQIQCRMGFDFTRQYARHDYRSHSST